MIGSLLIYNMPVNHFPRMVCDETERTEQAFIWGHRTDEQKAHMIRWSQICMPKFNGRLGIKQIRLMNDACFLKIGWRLMHERGGFVE